MLCLSEKGHLGEQCRSNLQCDKCNRTGHSAKDCYRELICSKCNRKGHSADRCYAKQFSGMALFNKEIDIIRWRALLEGHDVEVALDSGAQTSIISHSLAKKLHININKSNCIIETSDGQHTAVIGETDDLCISFEGIEANIKFTVTPIKAVEVLLGVDWFKQTGVLLDPKNETFIIPKRTVKVRKASEEKHDSFQFQMSMLTIENNDEMDYIDDCYALNGESIDISKMIPISGISEQTKAEFTKLLEENKSSFATTAEQLGSCKHALFEIETSSEMPVHKSPYRQPPAILKKLEEEVNLLIQAGIVRKGKAGTWTSPAFIIKQKGKDRMVIDFKQVNAITTLFHYPLPRIDDQFDSFQGSVVFSTIDLRKGFYQLELSESSKHKAGFTTPFGIFEFNRLPFGLANGPAYFSNKITSK